jgi:hypothetical protein
MFAHSHVLYIFKIRSNIRRNESLVFSTTIYVEVCQEKNTALQKSPIKRLMNRVGKFYAAPRAETVELERGAESSHAGVTQSKTALRKKLEINRACNADLTEKK